jgi:hypothetical protein
LVLEQAFEQIHAATIPHCLRADGGMSVRFLSN